MTSSLSVADHEGVTLLCCFQISLVSPRYIIDGVNVRSQKYHTLVLTHSRLLNNIAKFRSFKSKENIHEKEVGPYRGFGY